MLAKSGIPSPLKSPVINPSGELLSWKLELLSKPIACVGYVTGTETIFDVAPEAFCTVTSSVANDDVTVGEEKNATICVPEGFTVVLVEGVGPAPGFTRITVAFWLKFAPARVKVRFPEPNVALAGVTSSIKGMAFGDGVWPSKIDPDSNPIQTRKRRRYFTAASTVATKKT